MRSVGAERARGPGAAAAVGDACDNATRESFLATLECELVRQRSLQTQGEAEPEVFHIIGGWYNPGRGHSSPGCGLPVSIEAEAHREEAT